MNRKMSFISLATVAGLFFAGGIAVLSGGGRN
jgi:hypothetical protein